MGTESVTRLRVLLVEDEALLRESLSMLISLDGRCEVVGAVPNGEIALAELRYLRPQVVLTDIDMPRKNGIDLTREISETHPDMKVVILTKFGDDDRLFAALKAGAIGYLLKDAGIEEIRTAILEAAEGLGRLSPALVARVLAEFKRSQEQAKATQVLFSELTRREAEVLELLGKGLRNRVIADQLCLSEKTVKTHVGAILRKLHLMDRTEAALLARKHGLGED